MRKCIEHIYSHFLCTVLNMGNKQHLYHCTDIEQLRNGFINLNCNVSYCRVRYLHNAKFLPFYVYTHSSNDMFVILISFIYAKQYRMS